MKNDSYQIKDSVRRLCEAKETYEKAKQYYERVKETETKEISNYIFCNLSKNENSFDVLLNEGERFYMNPTKFKVTKVVNQKINWIVERLKERLPKKVLCEVLDKTYTVNDMSGLIEYLKTCNVDPKRFKSFIDVSESINQDKLNWLYDTGHIKSKDLKDCYTVENGTSYIKLTKYKKQDDTNI